MGADIGSGLLPGTGDNDHRLLWSIVAVFHPRRLDHGVSTDGGGDGPVDHQAAQNCPKLLRRNPAGAKQPGAGLSQVHNGGFHPHSAGTSVYNGVNAPVVVVEHVLGCGGGGLAGEIG